MSKSLKAIQVIMKIMKVLTMIAFICCIIGAVFCALTAACIQFIPFDQYELDGINLADYLQSEANMSIAEMCAVCVAATIVCAGTAVTSKLEHSYFKRELEDGTPFTFEGAKLLKRTSLICLCVSLGVSIIASIVFAVMTINNLGDTETTLDLGITINLGWYLFLLFTSVVFKYGAEQASINRQ